eukprot:383309-Prymnesium_polylepis.1
MHPTARRGGAVWRPQPPGTGYPGTRYSQSTGFVHISHHLTTLCSHEPPDALRTRRGTHPADP